MRGQTGQPSEAVHLVVAASAPALLAAGTALDVLAAGREGVLTWLAFWAIVPGVAFGAWCAAWAFLDWIFAGAAARTATEPGRSRLVAALKPAAGAGGLMATVVGLYGFVAMLRFGSPAHSATPQAAALEVGAAALLGMRAWLGSEFAAWLTR